MNEMVSIVVPTYNREKVIERAIRSILNQTYNDYEIIIVDDGSTDHTETVVKKIEDDRIRYIRSEENRGAGHARNIGIQESRYDFIAFLDSDDEWLPDKLRIQMEKILSSSEEIGAVYCRMGGYKRNSDNRYIFPPMKLKRESLNKNLFKKLLLHNLIGTPTVLLRKKCVMQSGGFKESLPCLEDWELFLRIAKEWGIEFVDEVMVEVHKLDGSISTNVGAYLVARCYLVSLYRKEMTEMGMIEEIKSEILAQAKKNDLYAEIAELLTRDIRL